MSRCAAFLVVVPTFAQDPAPCPALAGDPCPETISQANARPFSVDTQLGLVATMNADSGTDVSPTVWVRTDGPLAIGHMSLGRIGARLGLSSLPGESLDIADLTTYRAVKVGLWLGRVVGLLGDSSTTLVVEATFDTKLTGAQDAPLDRVTRGAGAGLRFETRRRASFTALVGYDEATASCDAAIGCTGFDSGVAVSIYGQVPIVQGAVVFIGDAILGVGQKPGVKRRDVARVGIVIDPVRTVKVLKGEP